MNYVGKRMNWLWNLTNLHLKSSPSTNRPAVALIEWLNVSSHPIPCLPSVDRNASLTGMLGRADEVWVCRGSAEWVPAVRGPREALEPSPGCSVHRWVLPLQRALQHASVVKCQQRPESQEHSFLAGSNRILLPCFQHTSAEQPPLLPLPKQCTRTSNS